MRGFHARDYFSAPVRVVWWGTCFCRRVLLLLFLITRMAAEIDSFQWGKAIFFAGAREGAQRGAPGGPGGLELYIFRYNYKLLTKHAQIQYFCVLMVDFERSRPGDLLGDLHEAKFRRKTAKNEQTHFCVVKQKSTNQK